MSTPKTALITGVNGQDGSYLADLLVEKGWRVHGLVRRSSRDPLSRLKPGSRTRLALTKHYGDVTDYASVASALAVVKPDVVFHLADQDHVDCSIEYPVHSADVTYGGTAKVLEACHQATKRPFVLVPSSSTIFGRTPEPATLVTPTKPTSPYAAAKVGVLELAHYYRIHSQLRVCSVIPYNHDSRRREGAYFLHRLAQQALGMYPQITIMHEEDVLCVGHAQDFVAEYVRLVERETVQTVFVRGSSVISVKALCELVELMVRRFGLAATPFHYMTPKIGGRCGVGAGKVVNVCESVPVDFATHGWSQFRPIDQIVEEIVRKYVRRKLRGRK